MDSICQHNNSYDLCGELMTGRISVKIKIIGTISAHQIQTGYDQRISCTNRLHKVGIVNLQNELVQGC